MEKYKAEISVCLSILENIIKIHFKQYKDLNIDAYEDFTNNNFEWACDLCLKNKKAIIAIPPLQNHVWNPKVAYYDTYLICRTCGKDFTFTKEEKKIWYETLQFWIQSSPVNCLQCRQQIRLLKIQSSTLSSILKKDKKEMSIEELTTVVEIYQKWNKPEKVKHYESLLKKKQMSS
ncbi:Probable zinc-ribbon domain-containing protein [Chryseobacterium polytrichastri]|uniref:Probable zinc-ribbon domain-containing protein n=2 Tax=Chryseobacterium polytrichastri TaxID=1302687 RepID=A0A1M6RL92_9FLAO|nr:Probable zinc-ribbon domain-containing protein [Chryseobacterium polytrichastri]